MAGKKQLAPVHVATPDDLLVVPLSLEEALLRGDRLAVLEAKRRIVIAHISNPETLARDLNALMRTDAELDKQIAEEKIIRASKKGAQPSPGEVVDISTGDVAFDPHAV